MCDRLCSALISNNNTVNYWVIFVSKEFTFRFDTHTHHGANAATA